MNSRKYVLVLFVAILVGTLFILSVSANLENRRDMPRFGESPSNELPQLYPLPEFSLIDSNGEIFDRDAMLGKYWVADFIFTSCGGPCPIMSGRMADLHRTFADNPKINFLSISVNPEVDTPEVLKAYAKRFNADTSRWYFLTGDGKAIHELAVHGFKLGSLDDPIIHSDRLVLVDDVGMVRGYYSGTDAEGSLELTRHLTLLTE